jgi:uncharacterized protein (TIRG00374 family)
MLTKKNLLFLAKICLSAGLIYWLLRGADLETIWEIVRTANPGILLLAFLMFYIGFSLMAFRWQILLRVEQINARFLYLLKSVNIAVLFNNLLPSTIGGDAYRMYDVWRLGGTKTKSVAVILIDRFLGMFALVTYGVIAATVNPEVSDAIPGLFFYLLAILAAMLLFIWMVFGSGAGILEWFLAIETRLLSIPQKIVRKISEALALYRGRGDVLVKALLISYGIQLNVIIHFILVGLALGIDIPPSAMFIVIPLTTLIMLMPVSINGIGVREAALAFFFSLYGIGTESAIAFAWVWLAMLLAQGMVGGIVFMLKQNRPTLSSIEDLPEKKDISL